MLNVINMNLHRPEQREAGCTLTTSYGRPSINVRMVHPYASNLREDGWAWIPCNCIQL